MGLYFPQSSYSTVINQSLVYGFEKGIFAGEAYVTSLIEPMIYRCRYACQMDDANGATLYNIDIGLAGDGSSVIEGWGLYFKAGNGAAVHGGNASNGGFNTPVISDSHQELSVTGIYTEAVSGDFLKAKNNGSIYAKNIYAKGALNFGRVETNGVIYIDGLEFQNITSEFIVSTDSTGHWEVKNAIDVDDSFATISDQRGAAGARYSSPHFTQASSTAFYPALRHEKALPHSTATALFKMQTDATATYPDITVGVTLDYTYGSDYGGGYTSEKGQIDLIVRHRRSLAPTIAISKAHSAQANLTNTLTLNFTAAASLVSGNRYETTVSITSTDSGSQGGDLKLFILSSAANRTDDINFGTITLL